MVFNKANISETNVVVLDENIIGFILDKRKPEVIQDRIS